MTTRKILIIIGLVVLCAGVIVYFWLAQKNKNQREIVLKIPEINYQDPGNVLSDVIITGYSDQTVTQGQEFIIEAGSLGALKESQVGDIKLKLNEIKNNSVMVEVLADRQTDQNFHPREPVTTEEISNSSCIWAYPLTSDASYEYCFTLEKEGENLALKYSLQSASTMPTH